MGEDIDCLLLRGRENRRESNNEIEREREDLN